MPRRKAEPGPGDFQARVDRAIDAAGKILGDVKKKYGTADGISRLSQSYSPVGRLIPLGVPAIEEAVGFQGWPLGVLVEIRGRPSSGKSTFAAWLSGKAQDAGVMPGFIRTEHSGVETFEQGMGLRTDQAAGSNALVLEEVFDKLGSLMQAATKTHLPFLGVFDSVAATPTSEQMDLPYEDPGRRGRRAAFLADNIPKLVRYLTPDLGLVFINQVRQNQDPNSRAKWYSPGGMALEHWAHIRAEMSHIGQLKKGETVIGMVSRFKVIKSKVAPPLREGTIRIYFDPPRVEPDA